MLAPPIAVVMVHMLLQLALSGMCLLVDLLLVLGLPLKVSHFQLTMEVLHAENLAMNLNLC